MNRERLGKEAKLQYGQLRCHQSVLDNMQERTFAPDIRTSSLRIIELMNRRDADIEYRKYVLGFYNSKAHELYDEHHAELYEMAKEEMEAEGIPLVTEDDTYKMTEYYYSKEIADLELEDPFVALGAKIIHIGEKYIAMAEDYIGTPKPDSSDDSPGPVAAAVTG